MNDVKRLAVVVLLPDTVPGREDFVSREFSAWEEVAAMMAQLEAAEPGWRLVSFCHIEDLPLLMEPPEPPP